MEKLGKYTIDEKVGEGGFGTVYRGRDPFLKRTVAIKVCGSTNPEIQQRFFREAEVVARLEHPNITKVYDFGFEGEIPYLVQEFLEGDDLTALIERKDRMSLDRKLSILVQTARGLDYAHSKGVIHRDVKPSNIRVLADDVVRIMDFGVAKLADADTQLTRTGMALGTAAYLAPEQIEGAPPDARCDVFSFGALAYELLSYERAFRGPTVSSLMYQILHEEPVPLSQQMDACPTRLEAIVHSCLAKPVERRYASLAAVLHDLKRLCLELGLDGVASLAQPSSGQIDTHEAVVRDRGLPSETPPVAAEGHTTTLYTARDREPGRESERPRSRGALWASIAVVGIALAGLGVWALVGRAGDETSATEVPTAAPETSASSAPAETANPSDATAIPPASAPDDDLHRRLEAARAETERARGRAEGAGAPDRAAAAFEAASESRRHALELAETDPERAIGALEEATRRFESSARAARTVAEPEPAAGPATSSTSEPAPEPSPAESERAPATATPSNTTPASEAAAPEPRAAVAPAPPPAPAPAPADAEATARTAIRGTLDRYAAAYEALDADAVRTVWPGVGADRLREIERAFSAYSSLAMQVEGCEISVSGDTATAVCTVAQTIRLRNGQQIQDSRETRFELLRTGSSWVVGDLRN